MIRAEVNDVGLLTLSRVDEDGRVLLREATPPAHGEPADQIAGRPDVTAWQIEPWSPRADPRERALQMLTDHGWRITSEWASTEAGTSTCTVEQIIGSSTVERITR